MNTIYVALNLSSGYCTGCQYRDENVCSLFQEVLNDGERPEKCINAEKEGHTVGIQLSIQCLPEYCNACRRQKDGQCTLFNLPLSPDGRRSKTCLAAGEKHDLLIETLRACDKVLLAQCRKGTYNDQRKSIDDLREQIYKITRGK